MAKRDFRTRVVAVTVSSGTVRAGRCDHRISRAIDAQSTAFAWLDNWPFVLPVAVKQAPAYETGRNRL
jgi:hypothetical protein